VFIYRLSLEMRKYIIGYFDSQFFDCSVKKKKKKRIDQYSNVTNKQRVDITWIMTIGWSLISSH